MNYTRPQRQLIAQAFKQGLKHLWDGNRYDVAYREKESYICYAIARHACGTSVKQARLAVDLACEVIHSRMDYYDAQGRLHSPRSLKGWLKLRVGVSDLELIDTIRVQAYRRAWLESLIEEFSK